MLLVREPDGYEGAAADRYRGRGADRVPEDLDGHPSEPPLRDSARARRAAAGVVTAGGAGGSYAVLPPELARSPYCATTP